MDFEIEQQKFLSALTLAQTVADKRNNRPALANVLLQAREDGVLVCNTTDLMVSVTEEIPVAVKQSGSLSVSVRHMYGVVRTLPNRPIRIRSLENNWAELKVGRNEFKLMGLPKTEFPELPSPKASKFHSIPGKTLADLIQKTQFSVSTDETRTNLNGVLFECDGKQATMVSTDGHRLTKMTSPCTSFTLAKGIVIPRKGMIEIKRVIDSVDKDKQVEIATDDQFLFLKSENLLLSVKLNNVNFPPYKQVIPATHTRQAVVLREELLSILRRAEIVAPEKTATVRLDLTPESLKLTADNPDLGVAHQEIQVEYAGEPLTAGFNARYLIEVLEAIDTSKVFLEFQGELDPCVLRPVDGPEYLGVVMPMRI